VFDVVNLSAVKIFVLNKMKKAMMLLFGSFLTSTFARLREATPKPPGDISTYVPYHPMVDNSTYGNIDHVQVTH
jgi:hypothetical protein